MFSDLQVFFGFLLVFVRCSGMMLTSPVFGAQNSPVQVRILTTLSISAALTATVQPKLGPLPTDLISLIEAVAVEAFAGVLLGSFVNLAMQTLEFAGSLMDMQSGLSMSQSLNPINGIQTSVLSQFKYMLGLVVFLSANGHHILLQAFVRSYNAVPTIGGAETSYVGLVSHCFMTALQIAAPVMGVGFLVDAALGLISKAVPQFQATQVGAPAKIGIALIVVAVGLPTVVGAVSHLVEASIRSLMPLFKM